MAALFGRGSSPNQGWLSTSPASGRLFGFSASKSSSSLAPEEDRSGKVALIFEDEDEEKEDESFFVVGGSLRFRALGSERKCFQLLSVGKPHSANVLAS